jgi:putative PIN family toxin of toxin-antitoxin system
MRVVLDTNVFVSGVFFQGPPYRILAAWRHRRFHLAVSPAILDEYQRVSRELAAQFPRVDLGEALALLVTYAQVRHPSPLPKPVCADPADDEFLACALGARVRLVVSGDRHLLAADGYRGIRGRRPRRFVEEYLETR